MSVRDQSNPLNTYRGGPDERGHFGLYGGRYVAETDLGMSGGWKLRLDWDGPVGRGTAAFDVTLD